MSSHLAEADYKTLQARLANGKSDINISRHWSRHFFLTVSHEQVSDTLAHSNHAVMSQKLIVIGGLAAAFLLIIACLLLIIIDQGWLALLTASLVGIFWTILAGFTTEMGSLPSSFALLVAALALVWFLPVGYQIPLALFALSIFCYRLSHILAQRFLTQLVTSSYEAWDMLADHIEIIHHEALD